MEKSTSHYYVPLLPELVEDRLVNELQVKYYFIKEEIKNPLYNLTRKANADVIHQVKVDSILIRNMEALAQSDRAIGALSELVAEF